MKHTAILTVIAAMVFAACRYEAPLVAEHTIPVDPALAGLWQRVPNEGAEPDPNQRLLILNFSKTEYMVSSPVGENGMHFRAYPIKPGGIPCLQLQVIGTNEGPPDWEDDSPKPFMVFSYEMKDGMLVVRTLNEDLVGDGLKTTEALQEAFLKHKDNKDLFFDPTTYRKVEE